MTKEDSDEIQTRDLEDGEEVCPVCSRIICPGAIEVCSHWLCSDCGGEFIWFVDVDIDFNEAVFQLVSEAEERNLDEEQIRSLTHAPKGLLQLLQKVLLDGVYYWTFYDGVETTSWETISDAGSSYYHPQGKLFAARVKREAERAVEWLEQKLQTD